MKTFENLTFNQIKSLIVILDDLKVKNIVILKNRYIKVSENFENVMSFLNDAKLIRIKDEILLPKNIQNMFRKENFDFELKEALISKLLSIKYVNHKLVKNYLLNFQFEINNYEYLPTTSMKIKHKHIRNLFMEIDFVKFNRNLKTYCINSIYIQHFCTFIKKIKKSQIDLEADLHNKKLIGDKAEALVMKYEQKRLSNTPFLRDKVQHIAKENVAAGYDILSWEKSKINNKYIPRYIEVKAVTNSNNRFYLSKNEYEQALELREKYYLYLVCRNKDKNFDYDNIIKISDPILNIFKNKEHWSMEVETYSFSKINN